LAARRHLTDAVMLIQAAQGDQAAEIAPALGLAVIEIRGVQRRLRYAADSVAAAAGTTSEPEDAA
jgi:hypothetical protein